MSISHYSNKYERTEWGIHTNNPTKYLNITGNAEIGGTIQVDSVANDDTETRLLVLNTADNVFEYRNVSSLPNPFNQDLNTFDPVEFDQVNIDGNFLLSTFNDSFTRFHQTPAVNFNDKIFEFQSDTDTGSVRLDVNNLGQKSAGLRLKTNNLYDGNAFIQYETGNNRWFGGINKTSNEYRLHYSPGDPSDNLYNAGNERLSLTTAGDLAITGSLNSDTLVLQNVVNDNTETKILVWNSGTKTVEYRDISSIPAGNPFDQDLNIADSPTFQELYIGGTDNLGIGASTDSLSSFNQTPTITTGIKTYAFASETSDSPVLLEVVNRDTSTTAHSGLLLHTSSVGGNQLIIHETPTGNQWTVGRQKSTETYRWNYSAAGSGDYLTNDTNTKMFLDTSGNLDIDGTISLNSDNLKIVGQTDSNTQFIQTPAITTGQKEFVFSSTSTDEPVQLSVRNFGTGDNAHTGITLFNTLGGGNMFSKYYELGCCVWLNGYQTSSNTFRWNYDIGGNDDLDNDGNTRMFLDISGNLDINGAFTSSPALVQTDPYVGTISSAGTLNKAIRTGFSTGNNSTSSTTPVTTIGVYYTVNSGGWGFILNTNSDWTAIAGPDATYSGADSGVVFVDANIEFTSGSTNVVELAIFKNGARQIGSRRDVDNGHTMSLSVAAGFAIVPTDVITLKVANHSVANDIIITSGYMNIRSL